MNDGVENVENVVPLFTSDEIGVLRQLISQHSGQPTTNPPQSPDLPKSAPVPNGQDVFAKMTHDGRESVPNSDDILTNQAVGSSRVVDNAQLRTWRDNAAQLAAQK